MRPSAIFALGPGIDALLDQASALLDHAPICDLLRECYGVLRTA
jgi:hypothetical protein